jgi:hypothetical protein
VSLAGTWEKIQPSPGPVQGPQNTAWLHATIAGSAFVIVGAWLRCFVPW